jgi:hypothetical protein
MRLDCGGEKRAALPRWTLRLDVDDELVAFCPDCDEREFGGG